MPHTCKNSSNKDNKHAKASWRIIPLIDGDEKENIEVLTDPGLVLKTLFRSISR
jgi:hypothetical protein